MRRSRRVGLGAAAVAIFAVAFAVGAWVVVPLAVGEALDEWVGAEPGRSAAARRVSVNPFTLAVTLHDAALDSPAASLTAERIALDFAISSLFGQVVALDELAVHGPRLRLGAAEASASDEAADPLDLVPDAAFEIARTAVSGGRVEWLDERGAPLLLDGVNIRAFGIDTAAGAPARFEIDVRNALGGVLTLEGELVLGARRADGRVLFENVDMAPIAARFFASPSVMGTSSGGADFEWRGDAGSLRLQHAALRAIGAEIEWPNGSGLSAASLEAEGQVELAGGTARLSGRVDALRASLRDSRGAVWLDADGLAAIGGEAALRTVAGSRSPASPVFASLELVSPASIDTLALSAPRATIVLNAGDGAPDERALDAVLAMLAAPRQPVGDDSGDEGGSRPFAVAAGRVELEGGVLEIVDAGLSGARPALHAFDVEGVIERAEGGPRAVAADLAARVADVGSAMLRVHAGLGEERTRDVALELRGVPADVFAEHARQLAGYALAGGVLDAALEYRVDAGAIEGNARVGARGVEIERTAESAGDVDAPLALALLEDPHGTAETAFGFHAADSALGLDELLAAGILARLDTIAAAPFAALGAAAGVDGAILEAVSFPAGEAAPSEPETVAALAEALLARPRIGLRVQGVAHSILDRDALAAQQIELHVTLATAGPTLVARPQPVDFASPRHRDVLDEFADERLSGEERETIASYFTRTPDGRIVEDERSAYYRALFDALVENESIPQNGIERLGRYRARAIADALTASGIPEARIEIVPPIVRSEPETTEQAPRSADSPGAAADEASAAPDDAGAGATTPGAALDRIEVPLEVFVVSDGSTVTEPTTTSPPVALE